MPSHYTVVLFVRDTHARLNWTHASVLNRGRPYILQGRDMVFKLFKSGDELYDEGKELIKRGEYGKARDYLQKSIDKEGGIDDAAAVKVALIDLRERLTNVNAYRNLLNALEKFTSHDRFEFGLTEISRDELITECQLTIRKIELLSSGGEGQALMDKGKQIQELAQDFQSRIGDRNLIILELFKNDTSVTGMTEFFNLMAVSYECMADAVVWDNPSQAAEYEQTPTWPRSGRTPQRARAGCAAGSPPGRGSTSSRHRLTYPRRSTTRTSPLRDPGPTGTPSTSTSAAPATRLCRTVRTRSPEDTTTRLCRRCAPWRRDSRRRSPPCRAR